MLRKFSNSRSLKDNLQLGVLTAFSAGMVNVASLIIFFAFTSNVTGHYAILAEEIAKQNWYQVMVVFGWIFLFFYGNFVSNFIVITIKKRPAISHGLPLVIEMMCLLSVGIYGEYYYTESLLETEIMIGSMLFAMGIQNGLTASISNFTVKTTHMTGLTTDIGILTSMFTKKKYRKNKEQVDKYKLLLAIGFSYLSGEIISGIIYLHIQFKVFFIVCIFLLVILFYDYTKLKILKFRL